jgi:S1-C subfamily serine protease
MTAATAGRPGAVVQSVEPGSATLLRRADVIVAVDGEPVTSAADVSKAVGAVRLGKPLRLGVIRGTRRITLTEVPSPPAYLGADVQDARNGRGALVVAVARNGPADDAGERAGDLIKAVDGAPVRSVADLFKALGTHAPGDRVRLRVSRGARPRRVDATLAKRPT